MEDDESIFNIFDENLNVYEVGDLQDPPIVNRSFKIKAYKTLKRETMSNLYINEMYMISKPWLKKWKKQNDFSFSKDCNDFLINDRSISNFDNEIINSDLIIFDEFSSAKLKPNLIETLDYKLISKELWDFLTEIKCKHEFKMCRVNGNFQYINMSHNLAFIKKTSQAFTYYKMDRVNAQEPICPADLYHEINRLIPPEKNNGYDPIINKNENEKPLRIWFLFTEDLVKIEDCVNKHGKSYICGELIKCQWNEFLDKNINFENLLLEVKDHQNFFLYNDEVCINGLCDKCQKTAHLSFLCNCKFKTYCSKECLNEHYAHNCEELLQETDFLGKEISFLTEKKDNLLKNKEENKQNNMNKKNNIPIENGYNDLKGEQKTKDTKKRIVGLLNIGNTCYMNAILQCLRHVTLLSEFFLTESFKSENLFKNKKSNQIKLIENYIFLLKEMNSENLDYFSPKLFKDCLSSLNPMVNFLVFVLFL